MDSDQVFVEYQDQIRGPLPEPAAVPKPRPEVQEGAQGVQVCAVCVAELYYVAVLLFAHIDWELLLLFCRSLWV